MLDWHRGQPGWPLLGKACHHHVKIGFRPNALRWQTAQPATGSACPDPERTMSCQTTTRHTSRAFLLARRECAGCFANAALRKPEFDARIGGMAAEANATPKSRRMLAVLALLCVSLLALTLTMGVFHTALLTSLPDMDVSQPVAFQMLADGGSDPGYGVIDRDAPALFGVAPLGVACFFAILSLTVLLNENGQERFIHKKRIGSSD